MQIAAESMSRLQTPVIINIASVDDACMQIPSNLHRL